MRRYGLCFLVAGAFLLGSQEASAEVMDKEPTMVVVWVRALVAAVVVFVVCRSLHWLLVMLSLVVVLVLSVAALGEIHDPHVGPAVIREAGLIYVISAYASVATVWIAATAGLYLRRLRRRRL